MKFEVKLINAFQQPLNLAAAAARTCYSSKGIVTVDQILPSDPHHPDYEKKRLRRDRLVRDLYQAGHHTTFQHAHFQFVLSGVSRHFVWSFLHSHPFYNSEQVSQRYVEVKPDNFYVPEYLAGTLRDAYLETIQNLVDAYFRLTDLLEPIVASAYQERFPHRNIQEKRWARAIRKKALEVARYVLPLATQTYLYHTISAVTLLRYHRLMHHTDAPEETRRVVEAMVQEVLRFDPDYEVILDGPLAPEDLQGSEALQRPTEPLPEAWAKEFDARLDGKISRLLDAKRENEATLAEAVRQVLGLTAQQLPDDAAIARVLDPAQNPLLGESLNLTYHHKLSRAMAHASWTFQKKLSHTADSQDQRHRLTPGSRPFLRVPDFPDYVIPRLIRQDGQLERMYRETLEQLWDRLRTLRRQGMAWDTLLYLLPNAVPIRFIESTDLLAFRHKVAMRLCYNAQEEIWQATWEEVQQIREINPRIGAYLLPPCGIRQRAGKRPICPEGNRYCGVPVWTLDLAEYRRII